ncbi:uncharacterized protein OCT59_004536 [Rhizophagus irregularis]|uniref:uncharacterized protein n=1 Tax=Rhizophagus irregularis TaxID=588596 RepID=UPI003327C302|nr:hypothetical protein OCT59_004536 [Rhizophagus irregularis]
MDIWDRLQNIWDNHEMQRHIQKLGSNLIPNEDEAIVEIKRRKKAINVVIHSIRYDERPGHTYKGIETIIEMIIENWVRMDDKGEVMTKTGVIEESDRTRDYFKGLLYLEETIANKENKWRIMRFQKSMRYMTRVSYPKYKDGWKNSKLTEEIIEEFIVSKQFEMRFSDVGSSEFNLVSSEASENNSENDDEGISSIGIAEIKERLERRGASVEELKIERVIRLGYDLGQILTIEFWVKYNELENLSDDKLKEELNEWVGQKPKKTLKQ